MAGGIEGKRQAVARRRVPAALDHAAVEQQLGGPPHAGCGRNRLLHPRRRKIPIACGPYLNIAAITDTGARHEQPLHPGFDRRNFLIAGARGSARGLYVGIRFANTQVRARRGARAASLQPNAFVRVAPDDTVTVIIGKSEMGQGIYTGLAMAVAEELDVDPNRVKVEIRPARIPAFNAPFMPIQFTGGSMSTSTTYTQLREAGARARAMLLAAAAQRWNVDVGDADAPRTARCYHGSKSLSYGELADAAVAAAGTGEGDAQGSGEFPLPRQTAEASRFAR